MQFKVGDKITLKNDYHYKFEEEGIGTIDSIDGKYYNTTWSKGTTGCYTIDGMLHYNDKMQKLKESMLRWLNLK